MKWIGPWLSLFASSGTLLCCALPSFLVALGLGATMAGLVSSFPQLVWISQYKGCVFLGSGLAIFLAWFLNKSANRASCPINPKLAKACSTSKKWSNSILILSSTLWIIGAFFAFVAPLFIY